MRVRAAGLGDLERIVGLEVVGAPVWGLEVWREMLEGSGAVQRGVFVAEVAGEVVGFAVGSCVAEVAELESVAVSAEWQRMGLGRALCERVMEWARRCGAVEMELEVRAGSVGARALYVRLGFEEQGVRVGYYKGPVEDAVLMAVRL